MKKVVLAILIVFLALGVTAFIRLSVPSSNIASESPASNDGGFFRNLFDDDDDDENEEDDDSAGLVNSGSSGTNVNNVASSSGSITLATLSEHNTKSDCWVGYGGKVYDVTSFLPRHPGSAAAIIPYCGTYDEFTVAFEGQHGTSKVSNLMKVGALIGDFQIKGSV